MGVFDDKKFDGLDWISQATEPIDSQMNDVLSKVPEVVQIDFQTYRKIAGGYGLDISIGSAISYIAGQYIPNIEISSQQLTALEKCFQLELNGEVILDCETKMLTGGEIKLIKLSSTMDEKILEGMLGQDGIEGLYNCWLKDGAGLARCNEILELLGKCDDALRTRSERKKRAALINRLTVLFKNNEWKIKDTELANKVGFWVRDYISDGNLASFSNFCRLKVMTHKDQPIYSMEEIV